MEVRWLAIATALLLTVPLAGADTGDTVATGHIEAGGPHTSATTVADATGTEGVDAFFFDPPTAGTTVVTATVDNAGLGYDLDLYFFDGDGEYVGGCATIGGDETCTVPEGAVTGEVAAFAGVDLDVTVLEA